jgi:hypothetical protein
MSACAPTNLKVSEFNEGLAIVLSEQERKFLTSCNICSRSERAGFMCGREQGLKLVVVV